MAKEPDQTRWVGIRPTDPSENIPVTESSPVGEMDVSPKAGCADFPTATQKKSPAIGDLQAPESLFRKEETKENVGVGTYNHDLYTVPAGKIYVMEFLYAYCAQADPTWIAFILQKGITSYIYYTTGYGGAGEKHKWITPIKYDEDEIVRIAWGDCLAGTDVTGLTFGYLIDKY